MAGTCAAIAGTLAGAAAIGGGLYAHAVQPPFGVPRFLGVASGYLSGVHLLVGLGVLMLAGGVLAFRRPAGGSLLVCAAALVSLVYAYDHGMERWTPLVYYWGAPWVLAWVAGICGGYSLYRRLERPEEPPGSRPPAS